MIGSIIILATQFNCVQPTAPTYHGNWYDDQGSIEASSAQYKYEADMIRYYDCLERNDEAERIEGTPWYFGQGKEG